MRVCICLALAALMLAGCVTAQESVAGSVVAAPAYAGKGGLDTSAAAAVLYEADGGRVLYAENCDSPLPMASTTKIMTAAVALEYGDVGSELIIPHEAVGVEGSSVYLTEGERFTLNELLYALLLESGNDAAVAVAIAVAGSTERFVELMNEKARALGLTQTHFANPHGLSAEGHYTTARELAVITAYALGLEGFEEIASTVSIKLEGEGHLPRYLVNHNKLLRSYNGLIGVKTGYTLAAGRCLVTAARRNGMTLIAVTLNDLNDWRDHTSLMDYGFSAFRTVSVYSAGERVAVPVSGGKASSVTASANADVLVCTPFDSTVTRLFDLGAATAPVSAGDTVALLKIYENGTLIKEVPLYARFDVARK